MHGTNTQIRTFLVIPDKYDGGPEWEFFALAASPEEACFAVATQLTSEVAAFTFVPERDPTQEVWTVRELPRVSPVERGVVPWEKLQCTFWRASHAAQ